MKISLPRKHPLTVLHDTARLLEDLAKYHASPDYVRGYAADVRRAAKELGKLYKGQP